ncbi:TRAP transporter substrate-binding protein [Pseudooceanicola sp. LIPI14-2-Ac024]|uniref:TRAP transporter substrate-binding protein n=1 Tax=Pseudooceanicola sp. LIPI14-2-Ac024 TaxID=3344875 RepID=UPI0035D135D9
MKKTILNVRPILGATALAGGICMALAGAVSARNITLATILNQNDVSVQAMEEWNRLLTDRTGGDLTINILSGGTLGGTRELIQQLSSGEIDVNLSSPVVLQFAAPEYQCLEAEYIYESEDQGFAVWRGPIGKEASDAMKANYGIEISGVGRRGSRNVTANVPVNEPGDMQGLKMRVTNDLRAKVFGAYGAQPAPLALSELYGALRQGVFDAQENPLSTIYSNRFHEVQDYVSMTEHVWTYNIVYTNSAFYEGLDDEQKAAFDETLQQAMDWLYDAVAAEDAEVRAKIEEAGTTKIIEPDKAAFRAAARPILEEYAQANCRAGLLADVDATTAVPASN